MAATTGTQLTYGGVPVNAETPKIAITCMICEGKTVLDDTDVEYLWYFHGPIGCYICDECKRAIRYAKDLMKTNSGQRENKAYNLTEE